ncbi:DUF5317 domain-containing protein [Litchfieldia salsa]|uniref:DUF5317 domain-containing protein n=1 Tax=Litchfieldia salsa TaxID=930152 RepID=A0A1H0WW55_9BACI|nr:DUF5317 domain-containing protein [Litchfieldia salsa]SDP94830.1 hypothetical protein SAMN05216565_11716 [Litchfieldia salsa]
MVFDGIILSFIIALLRKGNLQAFSTLKLKWGWIFPVFLIIQLSVYFLQNSIEFLGQISGFIFMAVYIVGMVFLYVNRDHKGFNVILIGVFLNFIVMVLNGGRMPVSAEAAAVLDPMYLEILKEELYAKHTLLTDATRLGFLGDIIPLSSPYPKTQVISIGDVVMNIGGFQFIQYIMVHKARKQESASVSDLKEVNN